MKDNFSINADKYAKYRPAYPAALFRYLSSIVNNNDNAWDCGTGNGQVALELSNYFNRVFATDISQQQLENAIKKDNIVYSVQAAEKVNFQDNFFDLIVIAQAIHWFDFEKFYAEVNRTAKENAVIAVVGYGLFTITYETDEVISDFYNNVIGEYWDKERRYIDEKYQTIPFPFEEIIAPHIENSFRWTFESLIGYLRTWSAVKHFIDQKGYDPIDHIYDDLRESWGNTFEREVSFPLLLRVGVIKKDKLTEEVG